VLRALSSIGVPTREEVAALKQRIDDLSAQLAALEGKPAKPAKAAKPAEKKPAVKKAAAKKPAAKKSK
jgi:BMFP domain-containing protein YqiC